MGGVSSFVEGFPMGSTCDLVDQHDHLTVFQRRVYRALLAVPAGRVVSYGLLARWLGCASPRAVGQALRANPLAPAVPCHRVIAADGRLGGFLGRRAGPALARKRNLLAGEGVFFDDRNRLVNPSVMLTGHAGKPEKSLSQG